MTEIVQEEASHSEVAGLPRGTLGGATSATGVDPAATVHGHQPSLSRRAQIALGYAKRGFKVFPIAEGTKAGQRLPSWTAATDDEATVRRWWLKWPNDNIGIACGLSGLCVVDVDQKKGKDGRGELDELKLTHGQLPVTLKAKTPNGGWHLYFRGTTGQQPIGKGIDVRSAGGYVLAPGSSIAAGEYTWCNDSSIADLPSWLEALIGAPRERDERAEVPTVELDEKESIKRAEDYLVNAAPPAIAFQRGNDTTYRVAARVRDFGLTDTTALDLMLEFYNPRCQPPWTTEEMQTRVANAYRYAESPIGSEHPAADFADEPLPEIGNLDAEERPEKRQSRFLSVDELLKLPPPQWLVRGLVPLESVGILYGPSGSLKSFLAFHLAACCATGLGAFPGYDCKDADAFYIAAEGGHGFRLRAEAWIKHHGAKPDRMHLLPGSVYLDRDGEAEKLAEEINALCLSDDRKLIVVDTLSANFTGKENTDDVARFLQRCAELARKCRATVIIVHHTGKDGDKQERGHYSIRANADFSIRMDRTPEGAKVEVQKFKDADVGQTLHLRKVVVEVARGAEFPTSLVLEKGERVVDEFDELDARADIEAQVSRSDGLTLLKVAQALGAKWNKHPNTLKTWVRAIVGEPNQTPRKIAGGTTWMEKAERGNGLIVRFSGTPAPQTPL